MRIKLKRLLEVDWGRFADVQKTCLLPDEVEQQLNDELDRLKVDQAKRAKAPVDSAKISRGNIPTTAEGKANIMQFIKNVCQRPKTIFDIGEKSKHSLDENSLTINTGIPALKAVLWDEAEHRFYTITTCPGAGACIKPCYARRGYYIISDGKNLKLINRLQLMMNHPDEYERIAYNEAERFAVQAQQDGKTLEIRWNDAGDFFSNVYFTIATNVTDKLKTRGYAVNSYAYTKVGKYVSLGAEKGMTMTFSQGAKASERAQVDMGKVKTSIIVPGEVFGPFFVKNPNGWKFAKDEETGKTKFKDPNNGPLELKQAIVNRYKSEPGCEDLSVDKLKLTDEIPQQVGEPLEYDAIILPSGDSDKPAQRRDFHNIFLLAH
jgi:hypothetical protein